MPKPNQVVSLVATVLTVASVTVMIIVSGQSLDESDRYSGWAIWGLAWFPWLLIGTLSLVVELKDKTPVVQRIIFLCLPYLFLIVNAVFQGKSFLLLVTQAGLMESAGLFGAYLAAVVWIFFRDKESVNEFLIPQLFGIIIGGILLYVVGKTLWASGAISPRDLFLFVPSVVARAASLTKTIRDQISPQRKQTVNA